MTTPATPTPAPAAEPAPVIASPAPTTPAPAEPAPATPAEPTLIPGEATNPNPPPAPPASDTPAPAAIPEGAVEVPLTADGQLDTSKLSAADRHTMLFGSDTEKAKFVVRKAEAAPATPAAPVAPAAEATPTPPAPPVDEDHARNFRFTQVNDAKEAAFFQALRTARAVNPNVNPIDVAVSVGYDMPIESDITPAAPATPAAETPAAVDPATKLKSEIAELDSKLETEAKKESFLTPETDQLYKERADKVAELKALEATAKIRAEMEADKAETARKATVATRQTVKADVIKEYPTANDDNSELGTELTRVYHEIKSDPNHPDASKLADNNGPRWIVEEAAKRAVARISKNFGLTEAQAREIVVGKKAAPAAPVSPAPPTPTPNKPATPPPVPRTVLVTAPPGGSRAPEAPVMTEAQIMEAARKDPALRRKALFSGNGVTIS